MDEVRAAWHWREEKGFFEKTQAMRVFHGPTEGTDVYKKCAIDRFASHFWITFWGDENDFPTLKKNELKEFLKSKGAQSAVIAFHPHKGQPQDAQEFFGIPSQHPFVVDEEGAQFWIRFYQVKHPGLFLDHIELRRWLKKNARELKVLNTFAYTGSLSVAAGLGGASHVTTLDLSRSTIEWAKTNWELNKFSSERGDFIFGDVFEWLPKMKKRGDRFDCVILDPPSFSRSKSSVFSTEKDLKKLHALAFDVLSPSGILVTSINSAGISPRKLKAEVLETAEQMGLRAEIIKTLELPETFPLKKGGDPKESYLKGLILRVK